MPVPQELPEIEELRSESLPAALSLAESRGWTVHVPEWQVLLSIGKCFALFGDDGLVSTVTAVPQGGVCALGMLLVRADCQRRGIGTSMLRHAMTAVPAQSFVLAATLMGVPVYRRIGFVPFGRIVQLRAERPPVGPEEGRGVRLRQARADDVGEMACLETTAHGWDRGEVITRAVRMSRRTLVATSGHGEHGEVAGFRCIRGHGPGSIVGPLTARDPSTAKALLSGLCRGVHGPITLQVHAHQRRLLAWAGGHGFTETGGLTMMAHGPVPAGADDCRFSPVSGALCRRRPHRFSDASPQPRQ